MMNDFCLASEREKNLFKMQYCKNQQSRLSIPKHFRVEVDAYEDLAPGQTVYSWIGGGKKIRDAVITFKVRDMQRMLLYYPVFPSGMGRELLKGWDMPLPSKWSVYDEPYRSSLRQGAWRVTAEPFVDRQNRQMRHLLIYARLFVVMQHACSYPMPYGFKEIYRQLVAYPEEGVDVSVIILVNNVISQYLALNDNILNCKHLQDFITYLKNRYPRLHFIDSDFSLLRVLMHIEAPNVRCYF